MRKKFKSSGTEHFTKLIRSVTNTAAWRDLSSHAKVLLLELKFEWKGPKANNNGSITLSTRQASDRLSVSLQTTSKAFQDLQAKGFIVVTEIGHPGVYGAARCHMYELTEIALPHQREGRHLYRQWKPGYDFEVVKAKAHNPSGFNGTSKIRT